MLANRLKILLAERDLTIKDTVDKTGISRNTLSNIVNNPYANVSTTNVNKLCNFLDVTPGDFYDYFPWDFSCGYVLHKNLSELRKSEVLDCEAAYYSITAESASRSLSSLYSLNFHIDPTKKNTFNNSALIIGITDPDTDSIEKLYGEMSPVFQHSFQRTIESDCCHFMLELDKAYNFHKLFGKDKIQVSLNIYMWSEESDNLHLFDKELLFDIKKKQFSQK